MSLYDLTLYDIICRNARLFPERAAWLEAEENRVMTFAAYKGAVDRVAAGLMAAGFRKGDRIGVIGKNCLSYLVLYGAAAALGGIVVPINWRLSVDEMVYNLNDAQVRFLFADGEDTQAMKTVQIKLGSGTKCFNLQAQNGPFNDLVDAPMPDGGIFSEEVAADDGFVIIHTAAVAGRPRGALLSHRNLLCANAQLMQQVNLTSDDVHLNPLPMFHIAGLGMAFCCFHAGMLNVNMRKFDAVQAARLIAEHKASVLFAFAPMMQSLLAHVADSGEDISSLRAVLGIDTPDVIDRYQKMTGGSFFSLFGQTETSMVVTMSPFSERPGSAGRPMPLVDIQLMDDNDRPVPAGQAGEIAVRGPMVFKGYWGLEAENAYTFRNGWHHTGDMGRFDADGYLWYVARKAEKELIKPGGENVYPIEVEKVILEHPCVQEVSVIGVPDPKFGEGIKAICVLKPNVKLTEKELIDFVGGRIARYKKPGYVQYVDALPKKGDGSIDRPKVKELYGK